MKDNYTFGNRQDYYRRFSSLAEPIGTLESGKTVWAWRNGLWTVNECSGASTFYRAYRVSADLVRNLRNTMPAKQALASVAQTLAEEI